MEKRNGSGTRLKKRITARIHGEEKPVIVDNISTKGGFLNISEKKNGPFSMNLFINNYRSVELKCEPKWSNDKGFGFEIISIENGKEKFFNEYIDRQLNFVSQFGNDKVFRTEIFINLGETNATGNVYFANYVKYQGVVRERAICTHIPGINQIMMETGIRLVTVDTYHKYKENGYFGDIVIGELTVGEILGGQAKLNIRFKRKADGALLGEGYQRFCCVDRTGKVMKMPKLFEFMEYYAEA